jgi:hypothetical protein
MLPHRPTVSKTCIARKGGSLLMGSDLAATREKLRENNSIFIRSTASSLRNLATPASGDKHCCRVRITTSARNSDQYRPLRKPGAIIHFFLLSVAYQHRHYLSCFPRTKVRRMYFLCPVCLTALFSHCAIYCIL